MDRNICFARTEKGRTELLGAGRSLKPRQRQVLFLVGDAISVAELMEKLPSCQELEAILEQLWDDGYIGQVKPGGAARATPQDKSPSPADVDAALRLLRGSRLDAARQHALGVLANLVGEQSPVYVRVKEAADTAAFTQAVAQGKKLLAAVASAAQAAAFEHGVLAILNLPDTDEIASAEPTTLPASDPGHLNGIDSAKGHALEIVASLVGKRSPVYARLNEAHNRAEFIDAVCASRKVIAAVASASHAQNFETAVLEMLKRQ